MSAVDRFDDWSSRVDDLVGAGDTPAAGRPIPSGDRPDSLSDMYADDVLAAIEDQCGEPTTSTARSGGWRGGATAGAMVVGLVHGVRDALDDEDDTEPVVEIDEERGDRRHEAVSVHLVWGSPEAGVATVRRWLL